MCATGGAKLHSQAINDGNEESLKSNAEGNKAITPIDTVTVTEYFNNTSLPNTLSLMTDDIIYVLSKPNDYWWDGIMVDPIGNITRGWFPPSHTQKIPCEGHRDSSYSINRSLDTSSETNHDVYDASDRNDSLSAVSVKGGSSESFSRSRHHSTSSSRRSMLSGNSSRSNSLSSQQQSRPNESSTLSELDSEKLKQFGAKQSLPAPPEILHISSSTEIESLLKTPAKADQPSFNFIPLWLPELTADDKFIFHDQALNLSSYNIPLLPVEGNQSVMEHPDTTAYSNGVFTVPMRLSDSSQVGEGNNMGFTSKSDEGLRSNSESFVSKDNDFENVKTYDLSKFYLLPTDITTWGSLNKYFKRCVEFSKQALVKRDKKWFSSNLNFVSTTVATYQMIIKILADPLKAKGISEKVSIYLRKMTSSLVRFIINGNLYMMTDLNASGDQGENEKDNITENQNGGLDENSNELGEDASRYLSIAEDAADKMLKQSLLISDFFMNENTLPTSENFPIIYARFLQGQYEGGNFTNQLARRQQRQLIARNRRSSNILLDDDSVARISGCGNNICKILRKTQELLDKEMIPGENHLQFSRHRNLSVLTAIYSCIPVMCEYLDTLESIDFTLFKMITELAAKNKKNVQTRHSESDDSSTYIDEDLNKKFYEGTALELKPLMSEFLHLKQDIHSALSNLVLDCQMLTTSDLEVFKSFTTEIEEQVESGRGDPKFYNMKTEKFGRHLLRQLRKRDENVYKVDPFTSDRVHRISNTLRYIPEKLTMMHQSVGVLQKQRQYILNYCSHLMNTDFNIASFFIAERHNTMSTTASQSDFYYGHKKSSESSATPWYLDTSDDEKQLVYSPEGLRGGMVEGLVAKLVDPFISDDKEYIKCFLLTFITFVTPVRLFDLLEQKYNLEMPEGLSYEEYKVWTDKRKKPQQEKIMEVIRLLFTKFWNVNYRSSLLEEKWDSMITEMSINEELSQLGRKVLSFTDQNEYALAFNTEDAAHIKVVVTPLPVALSNEVKKIRMHSIETSVLAEQLTLLQSEFFRKICSVDLIGRSYNFNKIFGKRNALSTKNISNFVHNCNQITKFTIYMILRQSQVIDRVVSIKYFVNLAESLLEMNNFSTMTAVISGLGSISVSRLKATWSLVPKQTLNSYNKMDELMSIGKNYNEYRNILRFLADDEDPCIPFLGMYLSDLRFTTDGNPDHLHGDKKLVNFSKRASIYRIIREVTQFSCREYSYTKNQVLMDYLQVMMKNIPEDEVLYQMSLRWEPRVSLMGDTQNSQHSSHNRKTRSGNSSVFSRVTKKMSSTQLTTSKSQKKN